MPRRVDHGQRRRRLAEAVWRIASERGLEAVTLRQVAAEAGVATRQVQYYFGTRRELLLGALNLLNERQRQRVEARIPVSTGPRSVLREMLLGMLPLDEHARTASLVHIAYFVRSIGDDELAAAFRRQGEPPPEELLTSILREAADQGALRAGLDIDREAETLLALTSGPALDLLIGMRTPAEVIAVLDYHLDRIFDG